MSSKTAPPESMAHHRQGQIWLVWGLLGSTAMLLALSLVPALGGQGWQSLGSTPVSIGFALVGALVAARTSNRVGWLFLAEALILAFSVFAHGYAAQTGGAPLPGAAWVGWAFTVVLNGTFPALTLALLVFPNGRMASSGWRPIAWLTVSAGVIAAACSAVSSVNFSNNFSPLTDPVTLIRPALLTGLFNAALGLLSLLFLIAAGSLVVRLIRAEGDQRLQLKWVVYATALAAVAIFVATLALPNPSVAFGLFAPLIPVAAGVAIFKYRLYDIDLVINKTLVFGALAAFITAVYVAIVVGIGAAVGQGRNPNLELSILATAIVAVGFQPARDKVQRLANRLVYGTRATPYEVLSEFASRMASGYESDDLLPRMARILGEGTGAKNAEVWLKVADQLRVEATWPESEALPPLPMRSATLPPIPHASLALPVVHRAEVLGALSLTKPSGDRLTPTEEKLAADLASGAGLVLRNVRLTEELLDRLEDLRASRQRLVAAQDAERRRLERNIHDGAQQQLVSLALKIRLARRLTVQDPAKANVLLEETEHEVTEALEDLRDLARGIYPPLLADQGLVMALEAQARRAPLPVDIEGESISRYAQETEACIYFCVLEALQNAAKYSQAEHVSVRLAGRHGALEFTVTDDGLGFEPEERGYGTGLQGMFDRLAAQGGDLRVASEPNRGTTISGRLPVSA